MRYYLYLSKNKIDMLFGQISRPSLEKIKGEIKFNTGIFSASLGAEMKTDNNYYAKLEVLEAYLNEQGIGNLSRTGPFIRDTAVLKYGGVCEYASEIAFFGNNLGTKKLALIGSMTSLIGAVDTAEANHALYYYTLKFMNEALEQDRPLSDNLPYMGKLEAAIDIALRAMPENDTRLDFLARVLHSSHRLVVATPIYVSYAGS